MSAKVLEEIARIHLRLETLETRGRDSLDFSDQAVWSLRDALASAFEAGRAEGLKDRRAFQKKRAAP